VTRIGPGLEAPPGTQIIDATGKYVFPGFIDPHVHITLPFMGTLAKGTHETGSKAALVGGTTTLIEMCCPASRDDALAGFDRWMAQAVGRSACDFTFHMGATRLDDEAVPSRHPRPFIQVQDEWNSESALAPDHPAGPTAGRKSS
jgi:dihydropyrimidinase